MATAPPRTPFDRAATDRRVRHPLQSLRGYIRTYVTLEGAAAAVLYLALWFWVGLALDYGSFRLFAFDWVEELNEAEGATPLLVRGTLLGLLQLGLVAVVAFKIVRRLLREFNDPALALVLERRFPRELGDRLITAVELADTNLADRYGYSQPMIDQTIRDAAERVERVPVRQVFDWPRLWRQWLLAAFCALGIYLLVFLGYAGYALATDQPASGFFWRFSDVAVIWTERNVLLRDEYWPRQAYLEVIRFQDARDHLGEMRVGRDEQRPDIQVRAVKWVVADRHARGGWRPLRWGDLHRFVEDKGLLEVPLPDSWQGWVVDLDDLDPAVPTGAVPPDWSGKTVGFVRGELQKPEVRQQLGRAGALEAVEQLLDWRGWTVDRIDLQLGPPEKTDVREPLRRAHPQALRKFEDVFAELDRLAELPRMSRRLRRLEVPSEVYVYYRGKTTKSSSAHERQEGRKYSIGLGELKESVRFTVRGEDFYTPYKLITLVPPPSLTHLSLNKAEPAYIYWRLQGGDQTPLKGKKQRFHDVPVSITGEVSSIQVPLGTDLELIAHADRELKDGVRLAVPENRRIHGSTTPAVDVQMDPDRQGFRMRFGHVVRPIEFDMQFNDLDNVKGRRQVVIEAVDDRGPQEVANVELVPVLRKPRVQGQGAGKGGQAGLADGFLITPDALLPFRGTFQDDYGLTDMAWVYQVEEIEFELMGQTPAGKDKDKGKGSELVLGGNAPLRRAGLVVSGLQPPAGGVGAPWLTPTYWAWLQRTMAQDLAHSARAPKVVEGSVPLEKFRDRLEEHADKEVPLAGLDERLNGPPPRQEQFRTHTLQEEKGFDFRQYLSKLKVQDPAKEAQPHYRVKLFVSATDNNVETGPTTVKNKMPVTFLVVSENELLAQILLEEESLRDRLEKAVDKLKTGKTVLEEQIAKLSSPQPPLSLVGLRADEVRKAVTDASSSTREVSSDYARILEEMLVNRVEKRRTDNVETKIVTPLREVLNPNFGHFAMTEGAVGKLSEGLEEDLARLKKAEEARQAEDPKLLASLEENRVNVHLKQATAAREQMTLLIDNLEAVLQAIGGELIEREIIALLVQIERDQRVNYESLRRLRQQVEDDTLRFLLEGKSK
jgi:hypothetical protein